MSKISLYIIVLSLIAFSFQEDKGRVMIAKQHDQYTIDNLGNYYLIKEGEIIKFLANGKYFARFSNKKYGKITSVDATNAMRIMLYYRDQQQIVFLDNQLSQSNEAINLENIGMEQTDLACTSSNNGFWIYNKANNELLRFNGNIKELVRTGNLKQILGREMNPNFIIEHNNRLYLNCPESGIYVFDIFGSFNKVVPLLKLSKIQVNDNILYFSKDSLLCSFDTKLINESCIPVKFKKYRNAMYSPEGTCISNGDTLMLIKQ